MENMIRKNGLWFLLLGSLMTIYECECRAVNISNTWTLPQEGFSVFYRFFRDKISWFEADAVCQFHHANLITVDNGVQFDAARAFLKELDVTEFVWIGLMRPQSTQQFGWTNSKPLDSTSGYWADPFPVMESPLCAVIDPARDFRWHALRCGGPETAAFLCEMEVPQWAAECTVQSMPSLTIQYMSESGTVELSRDCGEEGTRHMPCHGKEDRNTILNELTCIDDSDNYNSLRTSTDLMVDIHQKSVELMKAVSSDNKEDNNIGTSIDGAVKAESKSSDQPNLNLDDVMMGDQPITSIDSKVDVMSSPKIDKKFKKKTEGDGKYLKKVNKKKLEKEESDEIMMGDQPAADDSTSSIEINPKETTEITSPSSLASTSLSAFTETILSSTTIHSTTETRLRRETEMSLNQAPTDSSIFTTESTIPTTTNAPVKLSTKINSKSNPTHRGLDEHASTPHHQKEIQDVHLASDHFIPPMLLVRTQFSLSNGHGEHVDVTRKHIEGNEALTASSRDEAIEIRGSPSIVLATITATNGPITTAEITTPSTIEVTAAEAVKAEVTDSVIASTTEKPNSIPASTQNPTSEYSASTMDTSTIKQDSSTTIIASTGLSQTSEAISAPNTLIPTTNVQTIDVKKTTETIHIPITEPPRFRQPHAPKHSSEFHTKIPLPTTVLTVETSSVLSSESSTSHPVKQTTESIATHNFQPINAANATASSTTVYAATETVRNNCSSNSDISSDASTDLTKKDHSASIKHHSAAGNVFRSSSDRNLNDHLAESIESDDPCSTEENTSADLTNSDVFQPYRPNRRRVLTKPESHSYIKKVLG
ncbi:hypothetical protein Bhyg_10320 [Pseudolycoriella hygida]|uniref:C-type lectin domain-containing protein n=1 Tax=Pseudolycoriella hygida TaxID=35572 RepID=A0A9Q0MTR0_9DIPT|nr:hypothetical protein Bhyg_10320 [Pseudolycoriella hygida]